MSSVIRGSDNFDSVYAKPKNQCTAWVNFDGTTTPPTIRDSYNVSSVVRVDTGTYQVYFSVPMDNSNYVPTVNQVQDTGRALAYNHNTNLVNIYTAGYIDNVGTNYSIISLNVVGGKN